MLWPGLALDLNLGSGLEYKNLVILKYFTRMQSQVTDMLVSEFLRILEKQGRDWHRIRWAIHGLEREVKRSAQAGDPWDRELESYLDERVCEALVLARAEAIAAEEFEWAHEISIRLKELGWEEELAHDA